MVWSWVIHTYYGERDERRSPPLHSTPMPSLIDIMKSFLRTQPEIKALEKAVAEVLVPALQQAHGASQFLIDAHVRPSVRPPVAGLSLSLSMSRALMDGWMDGWIWWWGSWVWCALGGLSPNPPAQLSSAQLCFALLSSALLCSALLCSVPHIVPYRIVTYARTVRVALHGPSADSQR